MGKRKTGRRKHRHRGGFLPRLKLVINWVNPISINVWDVVVLKLPTNTRKAVLTGKPSTDGGIKGKLQNEKVTELVVATITPINHGKAKTTS